MMRWLKAMITTMMAIFFHEEDGDGSVDVAVDVDDDGIGGGYKAHLM